MDIKSNIKPLSAILHTDLALSPDTYRKILASGSETLEEREKIEAESKKVNAVSYVKMSNSGEVSSRSSDLSSYHNVSGSIIAIVPVKGVMNKYSTGYWYRTVGTQEIAKNLVALASNPNIAGIVLDYDSGGGSVDGNYKFGDVIYSIRKVKPIYSYVDGMACSAAYQSASQSEKIYVASPTDLVGSIGVFQIHIDESKYFEMVGMEINYIIADGGENKVVAPSTKPLSEEDKNKVKAKLNDLRATMIAQIKRGRGNRLKETEETYKGGVFTHKTALKMGLIDGVATLEQVVKKVYTQAKKPKSNKFPTASEDENSSELLPIVEDLNSSIKPVIKNTSMKTLTSVLSNFGVFGDTPTFKEQQILSAEEATATAKKIRDDANLAKEVAELKEKLAKAEAQIKAKVETPTPEAKPESKVETPTPESKVETPTPTPESKVETPESTPEAETKPTVSMQEQLSNLALKVSEQATVLAGLRKEKDDAVALANKAEKEKSEFVKKYNVLAEAQGKPLVPIADEKPESTTNTGYKLPSPASYSKAGTWD